MKLSSKKLAAALAFTLASTMVFGSAMGVLAADMDVSESDNKITFQSGGGEPTDPIDPEKPEKEIDPDEKEKPTGNTGDLRLDVVPVFDFGTEKITTGAKSYNALLPTESGTEIPYYAQVTDFRGTGEGWSLYAKMTSQFSDGTHTLNGAAIALSNVAADADATVGTTAPGTTFNGALEYDAVSGGTLIKLASAAVNEGMGTSAVRFGDTARYGSTLTADKSVSLTIPAATLIYANEYKATIQWTLAATP